MRSRRVSSRSKSVSAADRNNLGVFPHENGARSSQALQASIPDVVHTSARNPHPAPDTISPLIAEVRSDYDCLVVGGRPQAGTLACSPSGYKSVRFKSVLSPKFSHELCRSKPM